MAVHLPLGEDACREAKMLMLASGNLLKPLTAHLLPFLLRI